MGQISVRFDMSICFYHNWSLRHDLWEISIPTSSLMFKPLIWRKWEANSLSNLVRMSSISRPVNSHQKCCCYTCSCCEFCIRSLEKDLQMIPTLRLSYLCLVMLWIFMLSDSTPKLGGIDQMHWWVLLLTAVICLFVKCITNSFLGVFGTSLYAWNPKHIYYATMDHSSGIWYFLVGQIRPEQSCCSGASYSNYYACLWGLC